MCLIRFELDQRVMSLASCHGLVNATQIWPAPEHPANEERSGRFLDFNQPMPSVTCRTAAVPRRYLEESPTHAISSLDYRGSRGSSSRYHRPRHGDDFLCCSSPGHSTTPAPRRNCRSSNLPLGHWDNGRGVVGIAAILMAYRPEKLRLSPRRKRLATVFACAGLCGEVRYFTSGGLGDVSSNWIARWDMRVPRAPETRQFHNSRPRYNYRIQVLIIYKIINLRIPVQDALSHTRLAPWQVT